MGTTWGSDNITFDGSNPNKKQKKEEEMEKDINSIKYSPELKEEHQVILDEHFLKVKKAGAYVYAERLGVDSVAFILMAINANDEKRIGLINEYKDPIGRFALTAFGGSIDDAKYHEDLRLLVKDEVLEESGFRVPISSIKYHGKAFVSTQSNQFCHLFSVEVDKLSQGEKTTTNPSELRDTVQWISMKEVKSLEDWKSQAIILRRMIENNGMIFISTPTKKQ